MKPNIRSAGLVLGMSFILSACGGGGGGGGTQAASTNLPSPGNSAVTADAAGIWTGTLNDSGGNQVSIIGGIAPDGTSIFLDYSSTGSNKLRLYTFTKLTNNANTTSGTLRHFTQQGTGTQGSASNVVDDDFTGTLSTQTMTADSTTTQSTLFTLQPATITDQTTGTTVNAYDLAVSSTNLANKTFTGLDDAGNLASIQFKSDGKGFTAAVQFSSSSGCVISGNSTQVSGHNLFELSATVSSLGGASCDTGGYTGLMFFADTNKKTINFGLIKATSEDNGTVIFAASP